MRAAEGAGISLWGGQHTVCGGASGSRPKAGMTERDETSRVSSSGLSRGSNHRLARAFAQCAMSRRLTIGPHRPSCGGMGPRDKPSAVRFNSKAFGVDRASTPHAVMAAKAAIYVPLAN